MTNTSNNKLDMNYRPETYWGVPEEIVARIPDEGRRRAAQEAIAEGGLDKVRELMRDDPHLDQLLPADTVLDSWMEIGDCLPSCMPGEVEIARVIEEGVPATVFAIRARQDGEVIRYRVVNDTDDIVAWGHQETSTETLTLVELIRLIHSAVLAPEHDSGLIHGLWYMHYAHPPTTAQRAAERVSVASPYYDQLELWYEQHARDWVEGMEEREVDMARFQAGSADPSAKQSDVYVVDEGLVDHILRCNPKATRQGIVDEMIEWGF